MVDQNFQLLQNDYFYVCKLFRYKQIIMIKNIQYLLS